MKRLHGTGVLSRWNVERGFGFIIPDTPTGGSDIMVHFTTVHEAGVHRGEVHTGMRFRFEATMQPRGYRASKVELLPSSPYRDAEV